MTAFKIYADAVARLRVPFGFALALAFAWLAHPTPRCLSIGLPVSVAGLLLRGWATGHIEKNIRLAQSGPYRFVRNPLYFGTALAACGLVIAARSWALALIFTLVFVAIYLPVIELEEQHLRTLFPEFTEYASRVPALWPTRAFQGDGRPFRWNLYRRNREYQAAVGFVAGAAFLIAKMLLSK